MTDRDANWSRTTLGTACGINPSRPRLGDIPDAAPVLFVPMAAVDDSTGEINAPHHLQLGDVRKKSYTTFTSGDVLFAKITPCMENGKSAVVPDIPGGLGFGSTEFHVLRPGSGVNARFVWHLVRQESFRRQAEEHMTGSVGQARVPAAFVRDFAISLPPEHIQTEIVRILDTASALRRSASDHLESAERSVARFRQSVLAAACTGRLTADWRNEHDGHRAPAGPRLTKAAESHASPGDNTSDFLEIPDTWAWWVVEAIFPIVIDYRGRTPPHRDVGSIPHIRTTQIRNGRIDWSADRFVTKAVYDQYMTRGMPRIGDILFTMEAPLGEVGIVDRAQAFSIAQRILLLRPGQHATSDYLTIALQSTPVQHAIENRATGSGVHGIAYKRLRSVELPIPPLAEQEEIARRAKQLIDLSEALVGRIHSASRSAQTFTESALAGALEGVDGDNSQRTSEGRD